MGVSASNVNTTEISNINNEDVISIDNDLIDEYTSDNVMNVSYDNNLIVKSDFDASLNDKDGVAYSSNSEIQENISDVLISSSNSEIQQASCNELLSANDENNILKWSSQSSSDQTYAYINFLTNNKIKIQYFDLVQRSSTQTAVITVKQGDNPVESFSFDVTSTDKRLLGNNYYYFYSGIQEITLSQTIVASKMVSITIRLGGYPIQHIDNYASNFEFYDSPYPYVEVADRTINVGTDRITLSGNYTFLGNNLDHQMGVRMMFENLQGSIIGGLYIENGQFNNLIVSVASLGVGSHTIYIRTVDTNIYTGEFKLNIVKSKPTVTVSSASVNYNEGSYSVSGTCSVNGLTINLKVGSTSLGSATVSNGKWTVSGISSTKLNPGSYTLTATSTETDSYGSASETNTLTVSKSTPTVTVTDKNINYNTGTYTLGGTVKVGSNNVDTGTVTIYKDSVQIGTASVSGGVWTSSAISSTSYDADSYTITASYASNTYYEANSGTGTLTISKVTPTVTVSTALDIKYGNGVYSVSGTAKYGSNNVDMGTVTLKCGDTILGTASVSGGLWTVSNIDTTLVDPSPNPYTITAYYESNVNYNGASASNYLTVNKFTPDITIDSTIIWYNQSNGGVLNGKVHTYNGDFYSGFIDLYVNGELITSNVSVSSSGIWTYTLSSCDEPRVFIP